MTHPRFAVLALGGVLGLFLGCGPVEYLSQVSNRASSALLHAQRVEADRHAPYEYTKAAEYYRKAREEASKASFQAAIDYGRKSEELAQRAVAMARERSEKEQVTVPGAPEPPR